MVELSERFLALALGKPKMVDHEPQCRVTLGDAIQQMQIRMLRQYHDRHTRSFRLRP